MNEEKKYRLTLIITTSISVLLIVTIVCAGILISNFIPNGGLYVLLYAIGMTILFFTKILFPNLVYKISRMILGKNYVGL